MFSPCYIHVYVSIGTLESDLLSQSTPMCNQMDISLFIKALVRFISLFHKSNKIYKFISSVKTSQSISATIPQCSYSFFNKYFYPEFYQSTTDCIDYPTDMPIISSIDIQPVEVFQSLCFLEDAIKAGHQS